MGPFQVGQIPSRPVAINVYQADGVTPWDLTVYSSVNMIVTAPGEVNVAASAMGTTSVPGSPVNQIILQWNTNASPFASAGLYRYEFELDGPGHVKEWTQSGYFEVDTQQGSDAATSWSTIDQTLQVTGTLVTPEELLMAQGIIELVTKRRYSDTINNRIRARDEEWLSLAVSYQAVWQRTQPDLFTKTAYESVSQDGFSGKLFNKSSNYLGPLAERALKNCSWLKSRSVRVLTPFVDGSTDIYIDPLGNDEILDWVKI